MTPYRSMEVRKSEVSLTLTERCFQDTRLSYRVLGNAILVSKLTLVALKWIGFIGIPSCAIVGLLFFLTLVCHIRPVISLVTILLTMVLGIIICFELEKARRQVRDETRRKLNLIKQERKMLDQ